MHKPSRVIAFTETHKLNSFRKFSSNVNAQNVSEAIHLNSRLSYTITLNLDSKIVKIATIAQSGSELVLKQSKMFWSLDKAQARKTLLGVSSE